MQLQVPIDNGRGDVVLAFCFSAGLAMPNFNNGPEQPLTPYPFQTVRKPINHIKSVNLLQFHCFFVIKSLCSTQCPDQRSSKFKVIEQSARWIFNTPQILSHLQRSINAVNLHINTVCDPVQIPFYNRCQYYFFRSGFDGHFCLLKAICETAQHDYGYRNGVLGDLIHLLFT